MADQKPAQRSRRGRHAGSGGGGADSRSVGLESRPHSSGYSWTADYVTVTGDLCADLLSNIASEQRAKVVYQYLYRQIEDKKVRETIDFLLNREEAHNQMFRDAFNKVQETGSNRDFGTTQAAKMYFSMSNPGPNAFATGETHAPAFQ
jgi:Mn-containing catalase